jgi:aminopeptidase N
MKYFLGGLLLICSSTFAWAEISQIHHDLAVTLNPETRELSVEDSITVTGKGKFTFALGPEFSVNSLRLDGRDLPVKPVSVNVREGLSWQSVELGDQTSPHHIKLIYQGKLAALDTSMDHRDVLTRLPATASNEGSFLPASSAWYPLIEQKSTFSYRLTLDLPAGQRGLVPGRLIKEQMDKDHYHAVFEFTHPAEGIDLLAGPYQVKELFYTGAQDNNGDKKLRLRTYFHPQIADLASGYLDSISDYIDLYESWIGKYPFTEFSIVSSPTPTGFGLPTLTYLGIDVLRLPFIRFGSLGHEVLHNWWANGVYVDWGQGNWSEGLTTFMADYTYTERAGVDAARDMRLSWLRDFAAIPSGLDQPLRAFTSRSHSASEIVGYHKSAYLFLMLRDMLGTKVFDEGIRRFWKQQQFRTASWNDLKNTFEASSGHNLDNFFAQWLTRTGAPKIKLEQVKLMPHGNNKQPYRLTFMLTQNKPAYTLRIPIAITTEAGTQEHIVEVSKSRAEYVLESNSTPLSLAIDPDFRLFRQLDPTEIPPILRQVVTDPATVTVIAGGDAEALETARQLAGKMLDFPPRFLDASVKLANLNAPLLLIGMHNEVDAFLKQYQLPARPADLNEKGTAQVWAWQQTNGKAIAVVSAESPQALQALLRPLPHYGKESFLVFDHNKVIDNGIWPTHASAWVLSKHQ